MNFLQVIEDESCESSGILHALAKAMNEKFGNGKKMILSLDSRKATNEETVLFKVDDGTMKVNF